MVIFVKSTHTDARRDRITVFKFAISIIKNSEARTAWRLLFRKIAAEAKENQNQQNWHNMENRRHPARHK